MVSGKAWKTSGSLLRPLPSTIKTGFYQTSGLRPQHQGMQRVTSLTSSQLCSLSPPSLLQPSYLPCSLGAASPQSAVWRRRGGGSTDFTWPKAPPCPCPLVVSWTLGPQVTQWWLLSSTPSARRIDSMSYLAMPEGRQCCFWGDGVFKPQKAALPSAVGLKGCSLTAVWSKWCSCLSSWGGSNEWILVEHSSGGL